MKLLFSISVITVVLAACGVLRKKEGFDPQDPPIPPGTIEISDNLYFDYTEVTNFHYLEYLYWTNRTYGSRQTPEYLSIVPDSTVWSKAGSGYQGLNDFYLRHQAYRDYPLVGISYENAVSYCKWRSDRVMEYLLVKNKVIPFRPDLKGDAVFTIEKYFAGEFLGIKPDPRFMYYPHYTLPDAETYVQVVRFADSLNVARSRNCENKHKVAPVYAVPNCFESLPGKTEAQPYGPYPTEYVLSWDCKKDLITHLGGNLREMTSVKGTFFGNSFIDSCHVPGDRFTQDTSYVNFYTGFRNQCTYKKWEEKP